MAGRGGGKYKLGHHEGDRMMSRSLTGVMQLVSWQGVAFGS